MANPGIEIRWGKSISDAEQRAILRPKLNAVFDIAIGGLARYGMQLTDQKYAYFHAVNSRYPYLADVPTNKTSHYYLKPGMAKGRLDIGFLASKCVHEMVHQLREEVVPMDTVGELAATEGIAYNVDYLFRQHVDMWRFSKKPLVELIMGMKKRERNALYGNLGQDFNEPLYDEFMLKKWWCKEKNLGLRLIDIVGIAAITEQLSLGYEVSDLWHLPTTEALGYETAA